MKHVYLGILFVMNCFRADLCSSDGKRKDGGVGDVGAGAERGPTRAKGGWDPSSQGRSITGVYVLACCSWRFVWNTEDRTPSVGSGSRFYLLTERRRAQTARAALCPSLKVGVAQPANRSAGIQTPDFVSIKLRRTNKHNMSHFHMIYL